MRDPEVFLERRLFARYADPGAPVDADRTGALATGGERSTAPRR
jgi:hypothetical protein